MQWRLTLSEPVPGVRIARFAPRLCAFALWVFRRTPPARGSIDKRRPAAHWFPHDPLFRQLLLVCVPGLF
jgi:hypothetical protein